MFKKTNIFILRLFFLFFLSTLLLFSKELELNDLLKKYETSQELYHKTKKESAGHLIVFSRSDLDKMQAYTLNDILKTLRIFNMQTSKIGMTTLVKGSSTQLSKSPIKIYINSYELNSATLGDALTQYGKMSLYFVNHIEIYQGGDSVTFGNEPASMIIKLYTKEPSRENGISAQISIDTRAGASLSVIDAQVLDDYSYLINLDASKNNFKKYNTNGYELSRDGIRGQFNFKFSKKNNYDIEIGATTEQYDSFSGLGNAPLSGEIKNSNLYIQLSKYFDNKLKLLISVATEKLQIKMQDDLMILFVDGSTSKQREADISTDIYEIALEKKYVYKNNDFFIGTKAKQKNFSIDTFKNDGIETPVTWGPKKLNIYMIYLENLYNINKNNLISLSTKLDYYKNDFSKSSTEKILRIGYVTLIRDNFTFKLFGKRNYSYPIFRQTTFSGTANINPDLDSATTTSITSEAIYKTDKLTFSVGFGGTESKNSIVFNMAQKKYVNNKNKGRLKRAYTRSDYKFDVDNKAVIEYFKVYTKNSFSSNSGALVQFFNKIGKINIYNELIYRSKYTTIDGINMSAGYDYSLGLTYPINKKTRLKVKGENLLNKASEVPINGINISTIRRRGLLTVEYIF